MPATDHTRFIYFQNHTGTTTAGGSRTRTRIGKAPRKIICQGAALSRYRRRLLRDLLCGRAGRVFAQGFRYTGALSRTLHCKSKAAFRIPLPQDLLAMKARGKNDAGF
ncbi:hypothetical protein EVAR_4602_1 [Eumeta japonica]|uniref:Uncharacterized protein n=1 Tax=Eumeta variegata TaxID=151549 RepID=A0A4C1SYW5_EUMVA|nr:hypothetical protein EVAR_4602_1 [Eumeta japonica]